MITKEVSTASSIDRSVRRRDRNGFGRQPRRQPSLREAAPAPSPGTPLPMWNGNPLTGIRLDFFAECFCVAPFVSTFDFDMAVVDKRQGLWPDISLLRANTISILEKVAASSHAQPCTSI